MSEGPPRLLDVLRQARRSAADVRKIFLALYGLLLFVPLTLLILAIGRTALWGGFAAQAAQSFLRPFLATAEFLDGVLADGRWGLLAMVVAGVWVAFMLVGSFFGLAVTRMAAVELTCARRSHTKDAFSFARGHWHWAFLTPACLLVGAFLLVGLAALLFKLGVLSDLLLVIAAPCALVLAVGAVVLVVGLLAGGVLAWPTIATEWSDAFDAITRVYGYSFAHSYRVLLYRAAAALALFGAVVTRGFRAALVVAAFGCALWAGLGGERAAALLESVLLEQPQSVPLPQTLAGLTILACVAIFLTMLVARLIVFALVLRQAIYLLLRWQVDKVPMSNIDGYRPDDSAFDPTAQGFELVEVEEEIPAE